MFLLTHFNGTLRSSSIILAKNSNFQVFNYSNCFRILVDSTGDYGIIFILKYGSINDVTALLFKHIFFFSVLNRGKFQTNLADD